ncbi:MAG: major Facilitator Superfamily protein [Proteobacteria bacterium]|nr:major Facilitator Superfamily protein [Pseudomonadota bacterium]
MNASAWRLTLAAAALMALVAGSRTAFGLFLSPLNTASGIGLARLSFALALGQLAIGFAQPLLGMLSDRFGAARIIVVGTVLLALSTALPAAWPLAAVVLPALVASNAAGSAVASNGLLLGPLNRAVPAAHAGMAVALVGAGASAGQLLLGPATQWAISQRGWAWALAATAALSLLALPLALPFRRTPGHALAPCSQPVADVLRDARFWRVAASFGVCGFHVGFLSVHMPGVIERCGLPPTLAGPWIAVAGAANIAGSLATGMALQRHDAARLLAGLHLLRAAGVAALLLLPSTPVVMLGFAALMGASFIATLPPTSQLIARQHGVQRLGALLGVVMLVHQLGSFVGIGFGGWSAAATGADDWSWRLDIVLALAAAALVWPNTTVACRMGGTMARASA